MTFPKIKLSKKIERFGLFNTQNWILPLFLINFAAEMISKNKIKAIRQLDNKKHRRETGLFVAEGPKVVSDLLETFSCVSVIATDTWLQAHPTLSPSAEIISVTEEELRRVSFLQHPQQVMGVFKMPVQTADTQSLYEKISQELCLALDGVQDPGNLGTIIRIADWFGIETLICSPDTADAFSPKVIQATMGSIARVKVVYTDLVSLIDQLPTDTAIYGTVLDGTDIYHQKLGSRGLLVMGNEGNGISSAVISRLTHRLLIPHYPAERETADSLNVAIATAVACAEFRRRSSIH